MSTIHYFGKGIIRAAKNYTKGYSDIEVKVRDATSNDIWGPSGTQMSEIAGKTFRQNEFVEIMEMLDKRLNDKSKNWRHVYKSLVVVDFLLHAGSWDVVIFFKDNLYIIKTLMDFQHVDEYGKDQGAYVRQKAKDLSDLLTDDYRLQQERRSGVVMRDFVVRAGDGDEAWDEKDWRTVVFDDQTQLPVASSSANPFPLADPSSQLQFRQESQPQFTQLQPQSTQLQTQQAPAQQKENYLVPVPAYGSRWLESPSPITTTDEQTVLEGEGDTDESTVAEFLSPEKVVMRDLVLDAVRSADAKEHLFTLGGDFAKEVLGIIQQILDDPPAFGLNQDWEDRFVLRRLLTNYSQRVDIIPSALFLDGVRCEDKETLEIGGYADIFQAKYNGKLVALKRLRIQKNQSYRKAFIRETLTWRQLRHPHVLQFSGVDCTTFKGFYCMVSPWMDFGTLCSCIHKLEENGEAIPYWRWILEIARGIEYLHRELVVHGDLRGTNVLIDRNLCVRLADFGLALFADSGTASVGSHIGGSTRWMCPKLLSGDLKRPNNSCDIYSFGCVCVEVYSHQLPYHGLNEGQVIAQVLNHDATPARPSGSPGEAMSDDLWALVQRCWDKEATSRPSAVELVSEIEELTNAV